MEFSLVLAMPTNIMLPFEDNTWLLILRWCTSAILVKFIWRDSAQRNVFLFSKQFSLIHFRIPSTGKAASSEIGREWPIFYEVHWDYAFKTFVLMASPLEMHYQIVQFSVPLVASRHFAYENPAVIEATQWKKKEAYERFALKSLWIDGKQRKNQQPTQIYHVPHARWLPTIPHIRSQFRFICLFGVDALHTRNNWVAQCIAFEMKSGI